MLLPPPATDDYYSSTIQYTTFINGNEISKSTPSIQFGYFLIEFDMKLSTSFLTNDEYNRQIKGVCERYYSSGNYTFSSGSGIEYIHKSNEPIYLSSIHCRILDSDKKIITNLGDDNTIFIQIVRGNIEENKDSGKK